MFSSVSTPPPTFPQLNSNAEQHGRHMNSQLITILTVIPDDQKCPYVMCPSTSMPIFTLPVLQARLCIYLPSNAVWIIYLKRRSARSTGRVNCCPPQRADGWVDDDPPPPPPAERLTLIINTDLCVVTAAITQYHCSPRLGNQPTLGAFHSHSTDGDTGLRKI